MPLRVATTVRSRIVRPAGVVRFEALLNVRRHADARPALIDGANDVDESFGRRHAVRVVQDLAQMSERGKNRFLQTRNDG